jgi:hypothetical protein
MLGVLSKWWNAVLHLTRRWALNKAVSAGRSPGRRPAALTFRELGSKQTNGKARSEALGTGEDKWAVAQCPRRDRTQDAIMVQAPTGAGHVREASFNNDDKAATMPRTL